MRPRITPAAEPCPRSIFPRPPPARAWGLAVVAALGASLAARTGSAQSSPAPIAVGPSPAPAGIIPALSPATPTPRAVSDVVAVAGSSIPAGRASAEFRAPFDVVASVVTDFAHYREFIPQVNESRVIHRRRGQVELYLQVQLLRNMGTLWALSRVRVTRTESELVLEGELIDGNVHRLDLHLEARAVPGMPFTRVTMTLLGVPVRMIPDALVASQQAGVARSTLEAMQTRAEARVAGASGAGAPVVLSRRPGP